MDLKQRYKSRGKKRLIRFLGFYSILTFFLLFYSTFARYATIVQKEPELVIAQWEILINNNNIADNITLTDTIKLIPSTQTTTDNKLAPGQNGYFDVKINPEGTDVAIKYTINMDITNIPDGITLTSYEILEDGITNNLNNTTTIEGEITLQQSHQLTATDAKTIRVYWEWEEGIASVPTGSENYKIQATVTIEQKMN